MKPINIVTYTKGVKVDFTPLNNGRDSIIIPFNSVEFFESFVEGQESLKISIPNNVLTVYWNYVSIDGVDTTSHSDMVSKLTVLLLS